MNAIAMCIAALIALPAVVLVAWAWFSMVHSEEDFRTFSETDGLHFES